MLAAIVLGVLVGHFWPATGEALKPLGDGFIKLVKMIIAPLIFLTVVSGIAGMRELSAVGRVAGKAFAYFLFFSTLALIVGLVVGNLVQPGTGMNVEPATLDAGAVADYASKAQETTITGFLLAIIPTTMVSALTNGSILQTLFVAVLFGVALSLTGKPAEPVSLLIERVTIVVFRIVHIVMRVAPIGAFGAMAFTIGKYGVGSLVDLGTLVATFYLTSLFFVLVILGAVARAHGFSILRLIAYLKAELLLVPGHVVVGGRAPQSHRQAGGGGLRQGGRRARRAHGLFVQPRRHQHLHDAGGLAHRAGDRRRPIDGRAAAARRGRDAEFQGRGGGDRRGFITLAATLSIVPSVPVAGMALILGVDRFMSECRSFTNFIGNAVAAIVIARWEGKLDRAQLNETLAGGKDAPAAPAAPSNAELTKENLGTHT